MPDEDIDYWMPVSKDIAKEVEMIRQVMLERMKVPDIGHFQVIEHVIELYARNLRAEDQKER